jgi:hypothetical protein
MPKMTLPQRIQITAVLAAFVAVSSVMHSQQRSADKLAGTQSIGDAVLSEDQTSIALPSPQHNGAKARIVGSAPPIHILYVHGINQVGAGDSLLLRQGICKYLGECTVNKLERIYADGPFAVDAQRPALAYNGTPIWPTQRDWNASAPFIDRYEISGNGHAHILLDEFNWWPLAYPLKCKWLIAHDATLTGPSKEQMDICTADNQADPDHPGRYLAYRWIPAPEAADLNHIPRSATFLNRSLKNGLMDWGFGDAVMALGPMQQLLCAAIRELMVKSLKAADVNVQATNAEDAGLQFFFVTHSLGSFLSFAALDPDWRGAESPEDSQFKISTEERQATDYLSAHAPAFYFLANQMELLELAHLSDVEPPTDNSCPAAPPGTEEPVSIAHWQCRRQLYLKTRAPIGSGPQIIAWNDPDDLLTWEVPQFPGVRVVNIPVRNAGFKIRPFLVGPTGAHANYAKNSKVLAVILKPTSKQK